VAVGNSASLIAALSMIVVFAVFSAFIYQAMNITPDDKTNTGLTLKIAAAHMQVMAIASNLPFQWPPITQGLFRIMDAASSVSEDVIALECMFSDEAEVTDASTVNHTGAYLDAAETTSQDSVVYRTTLLVLVAPLVFLALATVFWVIVHCVAARRQDRRQRAAVATPIGADSGSGGSIGQALGLGDDEAIELQNMSMELSDKTPGEKDTAVLSMDENPLHTTGGKNVARHHEANRRQTLKKKEKTKKKVSKPTHRRVESLRSSNVRITWKRTRERIIVSGIVVAVLMHPTLTRRSVQLLTCDMIEGKSYLRSDLEVVCWEGAHAAWAFTVGLPFLVVYAFGIPFISWYLLYKRTHKLSQDTATIQRFGFLYIGYSQWWWEVSIVYWSLVVGGWLLAAKCSLLVIWRSISWWHSLTETTLAHCLGWSPLFPSHSFLIYSNL
jgi:hypothetical protein